MRLGAVGKTFANGVEALAGVDLDMRRGEFLSLLGPSGCGKSTILRLLAGLTGPSRGSIDWISTNHDLGFVFQEPTLTPWANVFDNVWLPLRLAGVSKASARPRVEEMLAKVGLAGFERAYPRQLSGGMKMRVSIARALVTRPAVLLMDEPFAALDEITRMQAQRRSRRAQMRARCDRSLRHPFGVRKRLSLDRIVVMAPRPGRVVAEVHVPHPSPRDEEFRLGAGYAGICRQTSLALHSAMGVVAVQPGGSPRREGRQGHAIRAADGLSALASHAARKRMRLRNVNAPFSFAGTKRFALAGARILASRLPYRDAPMDRDGFALTDVLIDEGRIAEVAPAGRSDFGDAPKASLAGGIVLPTFVDAHTHLDKAHIWRRAPNPTGDFEGALKAVAEDRAARWTASDVAGRMDFCLRTAYASGTAAIRTHIDSIGAQTRISWPVFAEARERWRGRIDLQAAPLFSVEFALDEAHMAEIEAMLDACGSNILGAVTYMVPRLSEGLDILFALAERKGWDLDFHVDEIRRSRSAFARRHRRDRDQREGSLDESSSAIAARCRFRDEERQPRTIEAVAKAGLSVVSLPMCNMFLQDRQGGRTPRWRGVTALHELKAAGVNVMIASDNVRDPFYAYGDLDMLEVWREGVRILHLDYPFADWAPVVREAPARAMGLSLESLRPARRADFILTRARDFTELFARPQADRTVLRDGAPVAPAPDYAEIDGLEGLS